MVLENDHVVHFPHHGQSLILFGHQKEFWTSEGISSHKGLLKLKRNAQEGDGVTIPGGV